jgi:hypothetical protein
MIYAGCDAHKHYSVFALANAKGLIRKPVRVEHSRGIFRRYLEGLPGGDDDRGGDDRLVAVDH